MSLKVKYFSILIIFVILISSLDLEAQKRRYQIQEGTNYVPSTVIIKLNSVNQSIAQATTKILNIQSIEQNFPVKSQQSINYGRPDKQSTGRKLKSKFLSNIHRVTLSEDADIAAFINEILDYENVQYAEPLYYEQQLLIPNDPNISSQDHLPVIKAYDAWDVTTGNPNIVIGVIDEGMQLNHQDLENQIATNTSEIENSVDDDGNGLVDDINGWDFADDDNNPTADNTSHGTRIAGITSASTDNGIGVAGVGYNSKTVPLKIFRTSDNLSENSYDAIIYAADQGYDVINLSWGSIETFSQFNQDVINYAAIENDVVVIAAAGNTNAELNFYPASYDNVISVGASDINDNKAAFATYSYNIDLMAPGLAVYATQNGNQYGIGQGSSFAAPQVAGAAALVRDVFPDLNALQVMQQLRITADDIYGIGDNNLYEGQLGKGRLNVHRAVTESTSPAVRMENLVYSGIFDERIFFDDTVTMSMNFINYLRTASNLTASISTTSPYISFLSPSTFSLGDLDALESVADQTTTFYINENAPPSEQIVFRIDFIDESGYEDFQYFTIALESDYLEIDNGSFKFTIASNGNLGYATDTLENGSGVQHNDVKIADQLGIVVGNHVDSVSNNVVIDLKESSRDTSFQKQSNLKLINYNGADYYSKSSFDDSKEATFELGLNIEQEVLAWDDTDNRDYIILEYRVSNSTTSEKNNLEFGFYTDWNLSDAFQNKANWDALNNLSYAYDAANDSKYAGIALISNQSPTPYAIDIGNENGNTSEINNDFTKSEKYDFLTSSKLTAGDISTGNDVANLLSISIGTLSPGASQKIAFVLTAGNTLADLQSSVDKAQAKYNTFLTDPPITLTDTACINENFTLNISGGTNFEIFDDPQISNLLLSGNNFDLGSLNKDSIIYYRNIDGNFASDISSLKILTNNPAADFILEFDTLFLGDDPLNQVQFTDISGDAINWQWDFDNGSMASIQNPKIAFNEVGNYQIDLTITSKSGCTGFVSKNLLVAQRSAKPTINEQTICKGETVSISSSDATNLKFYMNENDVVPLFEGNEFNSGPINSDTTFYVSSMDMTFESQKVPANITIDKITSNFEIRLDTLNLSKKNLLVFDDLSENSVAIEWFANDLSISNPNFEFSSETSLNIKQKVSSGLGCLDSLTQSIDLITSQKPQIADTIRVCKFDSARVRPGNGSTFYFYNDKALTNLIHKGTSLSSGPQEQDSLIFITGVSDYRESEPDSVLLKTIPFETEITATPEFLIIEQGRNVNFSSTNQDAVSWKWSIGGEPSETVSSPNLTFNEIGSYEIQLIAENAEGCLDTAFLTYEVRNVTDLPTPPNDDIVIYPNPANEVLIVQNKSDLTISNLKMYNSLGAKVYLEINNQNSTYEISTIKLPIGLYIITGETGKHIFHRRILISH